MDQSHVPSPPEQPANSPPKPTVCSPRALRFVRSGPPDPRVAAAHSAVEKKAQQHLDKALKNSQRSGEVRHVVRRRPVTLTDSLSTPRVELHHLSEPAQQHFRDLARIEAEAWLNSAEGRALERARQEAIKEQLRQWYEQKEAMRQAREEQERQARHEQERAVEKEKRKWQKRGVRLQQQVAAWAAEKYDRELNAQRATEEASKEAKFREQQGRRRRKPRQKSAAPCQAEETCPMEPEDKLVADITVPESESHEVLLEVVWFSGDGVVLRCAVPNSMPVLSLKQDLEVKTGVPIVQQKLRLRLGARATPADKLEDSVCVGDLVAIDSTRAVTISLEDVSQDPLVRCRE